jgi:anaerobic magnesium-protoporphyrin IX monomethyl ester cyclase
MGPGSDVLGKRILLVFPPMREHLYGDQWRPTESPTAPLGLMYLASPLIKAGYSVNFIDFTVDKLTEDMYRQALKNADFVLISCYTQALSSSRAIIRDVRFFHKEAFVVCGGPHCNETRDHLDGSDVTVYGEAEEVIVDILDRISSHRALDGILGVSYYDDGRFIRNPGFHAIEDLDSLEPPSFELTKNKKYGYLYGIRVNHIAGIMASRGCPYQCRFCTFRLIKYRARSVDGIIAEIQQRVAEGAKHLVFYDDNLLLQKQKVLEIMNRIIDNKIRLHIAIQGRVDRVDSELVEKSKEAGVIIMIFGIESSNQDVLDFYEKATTVEQAKRAVTLAHKVGLITIGTFIIGAPMEDHRHFEVNKKFFKEVPLDFASVHILDYVCGSPLWDEARRRGLIGKDEIHVAADKRLSHFTTEELTKIRNDLIHSFYRNPKRIFRLARKLTWILGPSYIFKLMKMFLGGTIFRSSNTFHGAIARDVRR